MPLPYWRELTGDTQKAAIADADKYFASFIPPSSLRKRLSKEKYERLLHRAKMNMRSFDWPAGFSLRAQKGLLTSLVSMAMEEELDPNYTPDDLLGHYQCLLLKPD